MAEEFDFLFRYQRQRLNEGPAERFIKIFFHAGKDRKKSPQICCFLVLGRYEEPEQPRSDVQVRAKFSLFLCCVELKLNNTNDRVA